MGANEDQLAAIRQAGPFTAPELGRLRNSLAALAVTIKDIAGSPGWKGLSADAAEAYLEELSRQYFSIESVIGELENELTRANAIQKLALDRFDALPSATAPSWVHDKLDEFDFPGIPDPVDLAQGGLAIIENFLGGLREDAAGRILADYARDLGQPATRTDSLRTTLAYHTTSMGGTNPPDDLGDDTATGSWTQGGSYRGAGYQGIEYLGGGYPPYRPPAEDDGTQIGVDDPNAGVLPGGGSGSVPGGSAGGGGLVGPGGLGTGVAVAGAGALAAARIGGAGAATLAGRAAGGARVGTGGLLGGGVGNPANSGGAAAPRSPTGTRGGSGLLGAGAQGAGARGAREKKKAAGRGLGGPLAPRLEDDDATVLPGEGARAGGRSEPSDGSDD